MDLCMTASLIKSLDIIVTVDTMAAHLAGALGKKVFLLLHADADWRWLRDREDSPWYPSIRLLRQSQA
jgi:ADP-heptose:LPS heptosyltransferase